MRILGKMLQPLARQRFDWLQLEVSGACNAACAYCTLNCYRDVREGGLMDMGTFERLQPQFAQAALVYLQGWGEPLLHPQFWEMAHRAKASGARVGFTTNGTRLDETNLRQLLEVPIDVIGVSIAGTSAANSDRWRTGNDFARLGEALRALKNMKNARTRTEPRLHIAYLLLASNWREIDGLPALADAWGASEVVVNNLSYVPDPALQQETLFERPDLWSAVLERVEFAREQAAARGIALHFYRPDAPEPHALCTEHVLAACLVSWQGNVAPCVMTHHSLKPGATASHSFRGQRYPASACVFGNVNETPFAAIWKSDAARRFRAAFERREKREHPGTDDLPEPCLHCYKLYEP